MIGISKFILILKSTIYNASLKKWSFFLFFFYTQNIFSQATGDFRSVATGNWSNTTTWERYSSGSVWQASGVGENNPGLIPTSATNVILQASYIVTLDAASSCKSLTIDGILACSGLNTLSVSGNWTNNNSFDLTDGTVEFIGSAPQTITGRSSFYNLTINNTFGVTLNSSISVESSYTVTSGTLTSAPYNLVLHQPISNEYSNQGAYTKLSDVAINMGVLGSSATINNFSSGVISIETASSLISDGDITNTVGASIKINGTLKLKGNWTNTGTANLSLGDATAKGTVEFNGIANQTLTGTASTLFENITINNAAGITLSTVNQEVSTVGVLNFSSGIITTGNNYIIINNTNSLAITGLDISNTKHINGNLRRFITNATSYDLPMGSATQYELAIVNVISTTAGAYLDAKFVVSAQTPPAFLTVGGSRVNDFLDYGYWDIFASSGSTVTYDLTVRETGHTDLLPTADKYAILSNLGVGWVDYATHSSATQTYDPSYVIAKRSALSSFGYFIIGKTLDDAYTQPAITNELRNEGAKIKIPTGITVASLGTSSAVNNYSNGIISIDGTLTSNGNIINNGASSTFKINGNIQLKGNWTNDGVASLAYGDASSKGTVEFIGTSPQTIGGAVVTAFEKLKINNSTGAILAVNEQIDEQLILTSGIVTTGGYKLINKNILGGASSVTGNSATSFINGNLQQWVTNSTSYFLPLGNSSTYELATFELSSSTALDYIDAFFTEDHTQTPPGALTVNGQLVNEFLDYGYWNVSPKPGGSGTYNIIVESAGHSNGGGTVDLYSVITDIGSGWIDYGSHSTGTQSFNGANVLAKRSSLNSFGKFIIGKSITDSYLQPAITNELRNVGAKFKVSATDVIYALGTNAAVNNYSSGVITNDGTISSEGSVTNDGAASQIKIDGNVNLKGNFTNNGLASFSDGDATYGTVEFNGSAAQNLNGTTVSEFENLKINNGAGVTIYVNQKVTNGLNLTAGLLNTGANTLIMETTSTTSIINTTTSYVNGNLRQKVIVGTYPIPIGTTTNYEQSLLEITTIGTVTYADISFIQDGTQVPPSALTVGGQLVTEFLNYGYWTVNLTGGGATYNLTIQSGGHSNGGGTPELYSVLTNIGAGWADIGSHSSGTQGFDGSYIYAKRSSLTAASANFILGKAVADLYVQPAITNELRNQGAKFKTTATDLVYVLGTGAALNNYSSGVITNNGTIVSIGDITNDGAASQIKIDGNIYLKGNFTNNGLASFSDGDATYGTVEFNGTVAQNINGTTVSEFENLKINNAAGVTLSINQKVTNGLNLTAGLLNTGANTLIMETTSTTSIINTTTSYVNGNLRQKVIAGTYPLPIGTTTNYEQSLLEITTIGTVTYADISFIQDGTQVPPSALTVGGQLVTEFLNYGYWTVNLTGGGATYNLTIQSGGHSNGGGTPELYSVLTNIGAGWADIGSHSSGTQGFDGSYIYAKRSSLTAASANFILGKAVADLYVQPAITNELRNQGAKFKTTATDLVYVLGTGAALNNYSSGVITNNGTIVSIGDITNDGAASQIKIDGNVNLKGNFTNNGLASFSDGDATYGTVEFNGTISQSISGTSITQFENLIINNAAGITLSVNAQTNQILTFTSGKISTGANKVIVNNTAVGAIVGFNNSKYIIGNLQRYVVNATTYGLPIGTNSFYELATVYITSSTGLNYLNISFDPTDMNAPPVGLTVTGGGLGNVDQFLNSGFWMMSSDATVINYDLTIQSGGHYNGGGFPGDYAVISKFTPPGTWADNGNANNPADQSFSGIYVSAKRTGLTNFGDFIIGRGNDFIPYAPITNELRVKGAVFKTTGANTVDVYGPNAKINNYNNGYLISENSASISSQGDITNNGAGSFIQANGTIKLKGTWTNDGAASLALGNASSYGTVEFNGTLAAQTITSNIATTTLFENLSINNTNGVSLVIDQQVDQILTLVSGKITTGANKLIVTNTTPSSIAAAYDATKYIVGNLRRYVTNATYDLPIGTATKYELATIQIASNTGLTYIDAKFTAANQNPVPGGLTVQGASITNFLDYGYWTLAGNAGYTAVNYNATATETGHTDLGGTADMYSLISKIPTPGVYTDNGIHSVSTQIYAINNVLAKRSSLTGFGDFVIGKAAASIYPTYAITNELQNKGSIFRILGANEASVNGNSAVLNNSNSAKFIVESTASFSSDDKINNLTSSAILNEGTINLKGTWTNNATASLSDADGVYGVVNFNGTINQSIAGTISTQFENLKINNANGVTLSLDEQVDQVLTFVSGKITTGANKLIVSNTTPSSIAAGYDATKYIVGNLRRYVTNATYDLPIGTTTNYELATIQINSSTGLTYIDAKFTAGNQNPVPGGLTVQGVTITNFLDYGYWTLTGNAGYTAVNYDATITETGHTDLGGTSDMYSLISKIPTPGTYADNGIHSSTTQTYAINNVLAKRSSLTDFGDYAMGKAAASIYPSYSITNELHNKGSIFRILGANEASVNGNSAVLNNSNSANFIVETTASFSSDDKINNLTSSTILNEGTINIKGTWTNNATASLSDADVVYGEVNFNGTINQSITGTVSTQFEKLKISNANGVTLSLDEQVDQVLTIASGKITTGANKLVVTNTTPSSIASGYNTTKYIVGNLRRYVTNATYDLPIGTTTNYELATIQINSSTGLTYIDAKFTAGNQNPVPGGLTVQGVTITNFLDYGYWTLTGNAGYTAVNYDATITETGHTDLGGTSDMYSLISKIPTPGTYADNGIHSSTTQTYAINNVLAKRSSLTDFGDYVLGKANISIYPSYTITNEIHNKGAVIRMTNANTTAVNGTLATLNNTNSGMFKVENLATFTSSGNINNLTSATIQIDGTVNIAGTWTNSATASLSLAGATLGTVNFIGTTPQIIAGTTATQFENLILNNLNGLSLSNDVQVGIVGGSSLLTLTSGKITTSTNKIIVTNTSAAAISGYSNSKYIVGNLRRYVIPDTYDLPIGTSSYYELATLKINAVTSGLNYIDVHFVEDATQTPPGSGILVGTMNINQFMNYGYWYIASDGVPVGLSYDLTVQSAGQTNTGGIASDYSLMSDLRAGGGWISYGTHNNGTQSFSGSYIIAKRTNPSMTAFGNYIIGRAGDPAQPIITNMLRNKGSIFRIIGANNISLSGTLAELNNSNSGIIEIGNTAIADIKGGVLINSLASIQIDGTLNVESYWTNNGTSDLSLAGATKGTVKLTGTTEQKINGSSLSNFENLMVNNSGAGISLSSNIQVNDLLTMTDGDINLTIGNIDLGTSGSITGETVNNRIKATDGVGTEGLGTGFVIVVRDINNVTDWDPAGLGLKITTTANLGITTIKRGYEKQLSTTEFLNDYGMNRYYDFTPSTNPSLAPVTLTMSYYDVEYNTLTEADLNLFNDHSGWTPMTTTRDIAANTLTATTTLFSRFTGAVNKVAPPLPIELLYVNATYRTLTDDVLITWATASETNNDYFTVERSFDAVNFEEIATVQGAGNSNAIIDYIAIDAKPYPGYSYFRIKQTDYDGSYEYTKIASVYVNPNSTKPKELIFNIFPNPTQNSIGASILLSGFAYEAPSQILIYNSYGQLVFSKKIIIDSNETNIIRLENFNFPAGIYYVILINDNIKYSKKLIITK